MSAWKQLKLRFNAAMIKGTARDIDKAQECVNDSDNPEVIVNSLNSGKIRLVVPKKNKKSDSEVA